VEKRRAIKNPDANYAGEWRLRGDCRCVSILIDFQQREILESRIVFARARARADEKN